MADLAKWLDGAYRIAGEPVEVDQVPGAIESQEDGR